MRLGVRQSAALATSDAGVGPRVLRLNLEVAWSVLRLQPSVDVIVIVNNSSRFESHRCVIDIERRYEPMDRLERNNRGRLLWCDLGSSERVKQ